MDVKKFTLETPVEASMEKPENSRAHQIYRELAALAQNGTSKQEFTEALVGKMNEYIQMLQTQKGTEWSPTQNLYELPQIFPLALQAWYESNNEQDLAPNEAEALVACAKNMFEVTRKSEEILQEQIQTQIRGPEPFYVAIREIQRPFVESEIVPKLLFDEHEYLELIENMKRQYSELRKEALKKLPELTSSGDVRKLIQEIQAQARDIQSLLEQFEQQEQAAIDRLEKATLSIDVQSVCARLKKEGVEPVHGVMHHLVTRQTNIVTNYFRGKGTMFHFKKLPSLVKYISTEILLTAPKDLPGMDRFLDRYDNEFEMFISSGYSLVSRDDYEADKSKVYDSWGIR